MAGLAVLGQHANAGSDVAAAPLKLALSAERTAVRVGEIVRLTVSAEVAPTAPPLSYSVEVGACGTVVSGLKRRTLQPGEKLILPLVVRVERAEPCPVMVSAQTPERPAGGHLLTSRGVVLNERRDAPTPGVTHGTTANGERTIEAPVGR